MKPRAIMMPDWLWESIQEQAEDTGIDAGEYIRATLKDRVDADSKADVVKRVDELEERIKLLEQEENNESDSVIQGEQSTTEDVSTNGERSKTQNVDAQADTAETVGNGNQQDPLTVDEFSEEYADYVIEAVNSVFPSRGSNSEQLISRRTTVAAALQAAINSEAALGRRELVDRFYDDDRYTSKNSFWVQDLRPVLQEVGHYDRSEGGYVFPDLSHDSEPVSHPHREQNEKPEPVAEGEQNTAEQDATTAEEASETQSDILDQIMMDFAEKATSLEPDNQTASEQDLPPVDDEMREQLEQAVPSSDWVARQRVNEILKMYNLLRQRGEANKNELLAVADADAAQYATIESMWSNLVEDRATLQALPGVEAPPDGGTTWKYKNK